jgi:hypothetical protein
MGVAAWGPGAEARSAGGPVDREALQMRASFAWLARDLAASRSSCAAPRELVGPVLAHR